MDFKIQLLLLWTITVSEIRIRDKNLIAQEMTIIKGLYWKLAWISSFLIFFFLNEWKILSKKIKKKNDDEWLRLNKKKHFCKPLFSVKVELRPWELALERIERQACAAEPMQQLTESLVVLRLVEALDDDVVGEVGRALDAANDLADHAHEDLGSHIDPQVQPFVAEHAEMS